MEFKGLTDSEVAKQRERFGSNGLTEIKGESFWKKLLKNFGDPMIKILLAALLINVVFTILGQSEWYETVGIAAAILIATFVSTFSEHKNENAFRTLQEEASKIMCKVYRNGILTSIPVSETVVGDYVLLQSGDKIPADGTMVWGELKVDQSVLNGESAEAVKKPTGAEKDEGETVDFLNPDAMFRGAVVCSGNGVMRVDKVGDKTVYGQIAKELQTSDDRDGPLKVKLKKLAKSIAKIGYIGGIFIAVAFLFQRYFIANNFDGELIRAYFTNDWKVPAHDAVNAVMLAVVIMVMAVPEGLPLMIAIVSAQNMGKMLKDNILVRKVEGIETAGSLNILFSDKTGTITKGNLEVVMFADGKGEEKKTVADIDGGLKELLYDSIFRNTDSVLSESEGQKTVMGGNATERAVLTFGSELFKNEEKREREYEVLSTSPFNSTQKFSATSVKSGDKKFTFVKGAPEKIMGKCKGYYEGDRRVENGDFTDLNSKIDALAERCIRVIAIAIADGEMENGEMPKGDMYLVGIMGIRDEIRPESVETVREMKEAGVQVVMVTGDRKETAVAIAKEIGLYKEETDVAITSKELNDMSDEELKEVLPRLRVIARALPTDKSRLVKAGQEIGKVVGMTGDGVNDSPALKKADVGFAMGSGTEVAKEASDIVILNNNFNSIDKAVLYGRTIFTNIRKFIVFQLTINLVAVLISLVVPLTGRGNPLSITQILWVNLVIDTLAALAFGGEAPLPEYMKEMPKAREENIVSGRMWSAILTDGLYAFAVGMVFLFVSWFGEFFGENQIFGVTGSTLMTGYFTLFIITAIVNSFNARTEKMFLLADVKQNKGFLTVMGIVLAVQILMVYFGGTIMDCYGLNILQWLVIIALALPIIGIDILRKYILSKTAKRRI